MARILMLFLVAAPLSAFADLPKLEPVDTGTLPIKLSAPRGWAVRVGPPQHKDLSTIASISPSCSGGPDISVGIQLDENMTTPKQVLDDQYHGKHPIKRVHGWECIAVPVHTEVMCAGKLPGLHGIVSLYFATVGDAPYQRFGDPTEFTALVATSLRWSGKISDLAEWRRPATDEAKTACK
jgi:hypothetical protein